MRIVAIDPGFERVGIAVLQKKGGVRETLLYSDCFETRARDPFHKRLFEIGKEFERIVVCFKPEILAIETLFFNTNQKTAMRVAEVRGALQFEAYARGLHIFEYTPLQVKTAVAGYGRAPKEQISAMVKNLISIPQNKEKKDDEIDAIAIGLTHFAHRCGNGKTVDRL